MTSHYIVLLKCSIYGHNDLSAEGASGVELFYLTHRNARITVDGSHGIASKNHSGCNFVAVAASSIDWVGGMKKNTGPAFTANLVRESGFLFAASLILIGIYIAHHTRFI